MQEGGGDDEGLTTGAKADFCFTAADTMLAGEKEKTPEEEEQLEGSEVEEAMVGLDGTTAGGRGGSHLSSRSLPKLWLFANVHQVWPRLRFPLKRQVLHLP